MYKEQLQDYYQKECEIAEKISNTFRKSNKEVSIKNFYPEFKLEPPYSTTLESYDPVWVMLPFFNQLIVHVMLYHKTPGDFKNWYGMKLDELIELEKRKKVVLKISYPKGITETASFYDVLS